MDQQQQQQQVHEKPNEEQLSKVREVDLMNGQASYHVETVIKMVSIKTLSVSNLHLSCIKPLVGPMGPF